MKLFLRTNFLLAFIFLTAFTNAQQCTFISSCGYTVKIGIVPRTIVPSTNPCASGYNYNVKFDYIVVISGTNNCYNGSIGIQPQIICSGQNNGYYTINLAAPTVGNPSATTTYTGTLTTGSNPYRITADCATATPSTLGCNSLQLTVFGPGLSGTPLNCMAGPLAVNLLSFTAFPQKNNTTLYWSTSTENSNKAFTIQHSVDGNNYTDIGIINSSNNSSTQKNYSLIHNNPQIGKNYYRLKIISIDNSFTYSSVINTTNSFNQPLFKVSPSATLNDIYIIAPNKVDIYLINITGQKLLDLHTGLNNIGTLPSGLYFIKAGNEVFKINKY